MLKKWSKTALLAAMAVLMLTVMGACSDDDDDNNSILFIPNYDDNNSNTVTTKPVAELPAKVGTDPFTYPTYKTTNDGTYWLISFGEDAINAIGTEFKITANSCQIEFLSTNNAEKYLLQYSYDDSKKEIYLVLLKCPHWLDKKGNLFTKAEYIDYCESLIGKEIHMSDYNDYDNEVFIYSDETYKGDVAEIQTSFATLVTYGYEKTDDSITLTLKSPTFDWSDTESFTLVSAK